MKIFLIALALLFTAAAPANATYFWERNRTSYFADGSVRIADPSSPASIGANNYKNITERRAAKYDNCEQTKDVLSVIPASAVTQNSMPIRMTPVAAPAMPVQTQPLNYTGPVVLDGSVQASDVLKPVAARGHYLPNYAPQYVEINGAPETYDNTAVSPGYGYDDPDMLMPLQ